MKVLYNEKKNMLLIPTEWIMPKGLTFEQKEKVWNMSYIDRVKFYATKEQQKEIYKILNLYPNVKITEYCNAF